jgi:hypothetical protein
MSQDILDMSKVIKLSKQKKEEMNKIRKGVENSLKLA